MAAASFLLLSSPGPRTSVFGTGMVGPSLVLRPRRQRGSTRLVERSPGLRGADRMLDPSIPALAGRHPSADPGTARPAAWRPAWIACRRNGGAPPVARASRSARWACTASSSHSRPMPGASGMCSMPSLTA